MRLLIFLLILTSLVGYAAFRVHVARSQDHQSLKSLLSQQALTDL